MDFNWDIFVEGFPALLKGARVTAQLTLISMFLGLLIGLFGGLSRISRSSLLRTAAGLTKRHSTGHARTSGSYSSSSTCFPT